MNLDYLIPALFTVGLVAIVITLAVLVRRQERARVARVRAEETALTLAFLRSREVQLSAEDWLLTMDRADYAAWWALGVGVDQ